MLGLVFGIAKGLMLCGEARHEMANTADKTKKCDKSELYNPNLINVYLNSHDYMTVAVDHLRPLPANEERNWFFKN